MQTLLSVSRFCIITPLLLLLSGCVEDPLETKTNQPLPDTTVSSEVISSTETTEVENSQETLIAHFIDLSKPPRHDTWVEVLESFPEIAVVQTVAATNASSQYAIGNEEYYYLKDQNVTLIRHTLLNAIMGVYENTSPETLIPAMAEKNYTKQTLEAATEKIYLYETFDPETFKQARSTEQLLIVRFYDDSMGISDVVKKYLTDFFTEVKNNTVAGFIVPYSRLNELSLNNEMVTAETTLIIKGDKVLAKYIGLYTTDDMTREVIRILHETNSS